MTAAKVPILTRPAAVRILSIIVPPLVALAVALTLYHTDFLASYENRLYDVHHALRGPEADGEDGVLIVAIDDASLAREGAWPWPRAKLARLLERIREGQPRAVGVDILVDLPEDAPGLPGERGDAALARVLADSGPPVILPMVLGRRDPAGDCSVLIRPLPMFVSRYSLPAAVNLEPDPTDARVRRFEPDPGDGHVSFPIAVAAAALGIPPEATGMRGNDFQLGTRPIPAARGHVLINYKGGRIDAISAADVLDGTIDPGLFFQGRAVLVGRTDAACKDFMNTPVPGASLGQTELMAGVEIWKEAIDTLLQDRALREPPMLPIVAGILAAAILLSGLMLTAPRLSSLFLVAFLASWLVFTHAAFRLAHVRVPVMPGVMTLYFTSILSFVRLFLAQKRLKQVVTSAFESYVSPHVLARILDNRLKLAVGGERKNLTILFADITGFTAWSERLPAEDVVVFLRGYFAEMNHVILDHGGIIDKLMGDGILAFFGDLDEDDDHAAKAVRAALSMQEKMNEIVSPAAAASGGGELRLRIGIHTGPVIVGNVGSERHFEYTVIGRNVNLAQRLEGASQPGGILVSEATWNELGGRFEASEPAAIAVKGFSTPVGTRRILGRMREEGGTP